MKNNLVLFIALAILVPALSISTIFLFQEENLEKIHSGHFRFGFEESSFVECNSNERWWVRPTSEREINRFKLKLAPLKNTELNIGYASFRGVTSENGRFGHLGAYDREFLVSELIEFNSVTPSECKTPEFWP